MSQTLLWVTDPWNTLAHSQDTTLRLIQETANMGTLSYWSGSDILLNPSNPDCFQVFHGKNLRDPLSTNFIELSPSKIHQLHYRVDPPVDFNYLSLLDKIAQRVADDRRIFSPPSILRGQSEKVPPSKLQHLAPLTLAVQDEASIRAAHAEFRTHDQVVSKPMNQAQSNGVKLWPVANGALKSADEWLKIFSAETKNFSEQIVIQEYLPGVHSGEVRMWFAAGHFIAALKKHPKAGDFRVLIDEGSKIEAYTLNAQELKVAEEVGTVLKEQRVALAAIDFISGKISDYNITSPGLLVQMEQVHSKNFAREILTRILSL